MSDEKRGGEYVLALDMESLEKLHEETRQELVFRKRAARKDAPKQDRTDAGLDLERLVTEHNRFAANKVRLDGNKACYEIRFDDNMMEIWLIAETPMSGYIQIDCGEDPKIVDTPAWTELYVGGYAEPVEAMFRRFVAMTYYMHAGVRKARENMPEEKA